MRSVGRSPAQKAVTPSARTSVCPSRTIPHLAELPHACCRTFNTSNGVTKSDVTTAPTDAEAAFCIFRWRGVEAGEGRGGEEGGLS